MSAMAGCVSRALVVHGVRESNKGNENESPAVS